MIPSAFWAALSSKKRESPILCSLGKKIHLADQVCQISHRQLPVQQLHHLPAFLRSCRVSWTESYENTRRSWKLPRRTFPPDRGWDFTTGWDSWFDRFDTLVSFLYASGRRHIRTIRQAPSSTNGETAKGTRETLGEDTRRLNTSTVCHALKVLC